MTDQQVMVAICSDSSVYHKVKAYLLANVAWGYPCCGAAVTNPFRIHLIPLAEVGNRRLCKRCERMKESND